MMQITKREWLLSVGLTVVLAAWALYALAIRPASDRIRTLQRVIPEKQAELRELQAKSTQYMALRNEFAHARTQMASQEPDFQLLPFLETLIDRHKLVAEPSGAITVAALLEGLVKPLPRTVCILSGGNVEWDGLQALLGSTP